MARNNDRDKPKKRTPIRDTGRRGKPKVCVFCRDKVVWIDYKDVNTLRRFVSDRAKIKARRTTGTCTQHQRDVATAIKTARELALIAYTQRTVTDKAGGRGEGRSGGRGGPRSSGPRFDSGSAPSAPSSPGSSDPATPAIGSAAPAPTGLVNTTAP